MIIETSANQFYRVAEFASADLAHVWLGVAVKRVKGEWLDKAKAKPTMVRKEASRIVE